MTGKRVHSRVLKILNTDRCIEWQRSRTASGYGNKYDNGRNAYVHRIAWQQLYGEIPDGLDVLHKCDNPPCYNPKHLFLGTHADNMADRATKFRAAMKLTLPEVRAIKSRRGENPTALGGEFKVSRQTIHAIIKGRTWKTA